MRDIYDDITASGGSYPKCNAEQLLGSSSVYQLKLKREVTYLQTLPGSLLMIATRQPALPVTSHAEPRGSGVLGEKMKLYRGQLPGWLQLTPHAICRILNYTESF